MTKIEKKKKWKKRPKKKKESTIVEIKLVKSKKKNY